MQGENQVGDAGAMAIGEALKVNNSVQDLDLVRYMFSFFCESYFGVFGLLRLKVTPKIQGRNQVRDTGAKAIEEALQFNNSVQTLDLVRNCFFCVGNVLGLCVVVRCEY